MVAAKRRLFLGRESTNLGLPCGYIYGACDVCDRLIRDKYDVDRIEAVQRRFTKRLRGLCHMPYYASRLCQLHLDSLASRRIKADLVMCYKILNNLVCIDRDHFFTLSTVRLTRGNTI